MRDLRLVHSHTWFEHSDTGPPPAHDAGEAGDRPAPLQPGRGERDSALHALDPKVQAMVEHVRIVVPLPHVIRARALARARAAIAALHR